MCFEKCIRYLNRNAYTIVALKGKDFCPAAIDAFGLIFRNPVRFAVVGGMGELFNIFGRLAISGLTALIGYFILSQDSYAT